jgi:tripartite-type tricarboxylate transporter receptor subunit TctC
MSRRLFFVLLSLVLCGSLFPPEAISLDYPTREIEIIAGFPPGSTLDQIARVVAKFGEKHVGKPMEAEEQGDFLPWRPPNRMATRLGSYLNQPFFSPI